MDQRTFILIILLLALPQAAHAAGPWKRELPANAAGREAFGKKDYDGALKRFDEADQAADGEEKKRAAFNRGGALLKAGKAKEAEQAFGEAAASEDSILRSDALFNRGLSRETQQDNPGAIEAYRRALLENPGNERARTNLQHLLLAPPPPPQQQQSKQDSKQNDSEKQKQEQQQAQKEKEEQEKKEQEKAPGEEEKQPDEKNQDEQEQAAKPGELTQKEADDILQSSERDNTGPRLLQSGKPPNDYDPQRDW